MLTSLALTVGGAAIVLVGIYLWRRPDLYYRYLHGASIWASVNARPPEWTVKLGAALSVLVGLVVVAWGIGRLVS
jgi:hypothetical protein